MTNTHTVKPTIMSRSSQDRWYIRSQAQIGKYRLSRLPPVELVGVVICCIYACKRARSARSYWEPRLAGKIAPMSQRKGMKIPMIPRAMCPFRNVNKHTVKRQKM
jgi:hypothetical protein